MRRVVALMLALNATGALAYEPRVCSTDSSVFPTYPGGSPWPLVFLTNMPSGNSSNGIVQGAMFDWNSIVGAYDNLSVASGSSGLCRLANNANRSTIGWDDGTCYSWGTNEVGVTVTSTVNCSVVRAEVYFNQNAGLSSDWLAATALHELGHYQNAAHQWGVVSIMGYSNAPLPGLVSDDHLFLRSVWGSGTTTLPDLWITNFILRNPVLPGQQSEIQSPPPSCSGSCTNLQTQDTISVELTSGNAGSTRVNGTYTVEMRLGSRTIGTWSFTNVPAHAQGQQVFTGTIPPGIPPGTYTLTVEIDPAGAISQSTGPSPGESVSFSGFQVRAPAGWTCLSSHYNSLDGCDCNCGVVDPDCSPSTPVARGCSDANLCTDDRCNTSGQCVFASNTALCEDGLYCSVTDRCASGVCAAGTPRDCSALTNTCALGSCSEPGRACVATPRNEDAGCTDTLFCTVSEVCRSGTCVGVPRDCSALDGVCAVGTCSESTDQCVATPRNQGGACDDGLRCTLNDSCQSGRCAGTQRDCSSLNTACMRGVCDAATGGCIAVPVLDGTTCDDGLFCTQTETCTAGVCGGGAARSCAAQTSSCSVGTCDEAMDRCVAVPTNEAGACNDGLFCTTQDHCASGLCVGAAMDCSASTGACTLGVCDETLDRCRAAPANEGQTCNDGLLCSSADRCTNGACVGTQLNCAQPAGSCLVGSCDPQTGACVTTTKADNSACDDGLFCTANDRCVAGQCRGSAQDCSQLTGGCLVGTCDEQANRCVARAVPDGQSCNDGLKCTQSDSCVAGTCTGTSISCAQPNDPCLGALCNPVTGACMNTPRADGTACDDGQFCTVNDSCVAGRCGGAPKVCAGDPRCAVSACDEANDNCLAVPKPDGTSCSDSNGCTNGDMCRAGVCTGEVLNCVSSECPDGTCEPISGQCFSPSQGLSCRPGPQGVQPTPCGCSSSDALVHVMLLAGLWLVRRRRRQQQL